MQNSVLIPPRTYIQGLKSRRLQKAMIVEVRDMCGIEPVLQPAVLTCAVGATNDTNTSSSPMVPSPYISPPHASDDRGEATDDIQNVDASEIPVPGSSRIKYLRDLYAENGQTLQGSFSNFARKYAFESSRRDLHKAQVTFANFANFAIWKKPAD